MTLFISETERAVGVHLLADFYGVDYIFLIDEALLKHCLSEAVAAVRATPLSDPVIHIFPGGGLTGFLPLAESHIAFHSYPERNYLALDLFTCGACPPDRALEVFQERLNPRQCTVHRISRGANSDQDSGKPEG